MGKLLKKEDLTRFLYRLKQKGDLIAPVKTNNVTFELIDDIKNIHLDTIPHHSIKKFFLPQHNTVFRFDTARILKPEKIKERIIFGARLCDLNALLRNDKLFLNPASVDTKYQKLRDNTTLIGYNCPTPNDNCFCESMDLENYYDLFFHDMGDHYYIDVGSEKGLKLVSRLTNYEYSPRGITCTKKLTRTLSEKHFNSPAWKKNAEKCLSCGKCTLVCPTCLCFTMEEKLDISLEKGKREMVWGSCQFKDFTKVAGGFVFRKDLDQRLRHRIYHKLLYFKEKYSKDMCVGCGRCIDTCPTKIDFVKIVNSLK